ncbi:MAG: MFS transporter [Methanomassiliicoccales archaeon]|jgi:MFS family permease|nr:MFS transporter [Methanomassiliicoccales archaeon]
MADPKRLAVYLGSFIGPVSGNAVLALVPTLKSELNASAPSVLLSISFFMIPFALFTLFSGTISDVYDRKKTVLIGFSFYAIGSMMCALSPNLPVFLLSRTVQGFGYGFVNPVLVAILGDIVPYEERGKAMGYLGAATTAGIALGPFIAGFIVLISWRAVFIFIAILVMFVAIFFDRQFRDVLFVKGSQTPREILRNLKRAIGEKSVLVLSITGFLTFLGYISTISFMSDHLSLPPLGLSESEIGTVMATTGIAGILAAPIGGRLTDKIGRFATPTIGYVLIVVSMIMLSYAQSVYLIIASLVVLGAGTAIVWAPLLTLSVEIRPGQRGTTSSLFNGARFFGYSLAPLVAAPIYVVSGIEAIYIFTIALAVSAILAIWLVRFLMESASPGPSTPKSQ